MWEKSTKNFQPFRVKTFEKVVICVLDLIVVFDILSLDIDGEIL